MPEAASGNGGDKPLDKRSFGLRDVLQGIVFFAAAPGLYALAVWLIGADVAWGWHTGGVAMAIVLAAVTSIMGESVIEDVVKFVMIAICASLTIFWLPAEVQVFLIGAACGSACPLLFRAALK